MELSDLQKNILSIICKMKDPPTYNILIQQLNRDRITILNSCESLIKSEIIIKEKINPEYEKSKIIFKPTMKGEIVYLFGKFSNNIFNIRQLKEIERYYYLSQFIKEITNYDYQFSLLSRIYYNLVRSKININNSEGYTFTESEAITNGFKEALLYSMENSDYNPKIIFNIHSNKFLEKIFEKEWNHLKEKLRMTNKNLDKTLQQLP